MRGRLRYCCRIFSILDLVVIIVGFSMIALGRDNESSRSLSATSTLRSIRFLQIARVFRLDRCGTSWKLLRSVFLTHVKELLSAVYLGSLTLVFSSFAIYRLESGINQQVLIWTNKRPVFSSHANKNRAFQIFVEWNWPLRYIWRCSLVGRINLFDHRLWR